MRYSNIWEIVNEYKIDNGGTAYMISYDNNYALEFYNQGHKYIGCTHSVGNMETAKRLLLAYYPKAERLSLYY